MIYTEIPEGADLQTVNQYLTSFLNEKEELAERYSAIYTLEQLSYIAEQYAFYRVERDLEKDVSSYLIDMIDYDDPELMDVLTFIVVNMSLHNVMDYLQEHKQGKLTEVVKMIEDSAGEMVN